MRSFLSNSLKVCVFVFSVLFSVQALAQTVTVSQLDCTPAQAHCTSNDLQIVGVFVDGPACATCVSGQPVQYPLKMTIHNGTKSVRTAFALYGTLSGGATINGIGGKIFICVGPVTVKSNETLPGESAPGNQTFLVGTISFNCGQSLTLADNILAWTDASGTTDERCTTFQAATECSNVEPKCGEAGSITIRQPLNASYTTTVACTGVNQGKIKVTPVGGLAPYTIVLKKGAATVATQTNVTTSGYEFTGLAAGTDYSAVITDATTPTGCTYTLTPISLGSGAVPTALSLTGSSICASAPGTGTITSTSSETGVSYQLKDASNNNVQSAKAGTGSGLTWSSLAAGNGYYVVATGGSPTNCTSTSNSVNVASVNNPLALVLTGSSICASAPGTGTITSSASQTGVSYQLKDGSNNNVQSAQAGTGAGLTWSSLAAGNGYYVVATGAAPTNCTSTSNTANVLSVNNPTTLVLTGSSICPAANGTGTITSSGSQTGVSYQLKDGSNNNVQSAKSGTGAGLTWSNLNAGTGYHVVSTGASPTNCPGSSNSVDVSLKNNPGTPNVQYVAPQCFETTFSLIVSSIEAGASYTLLNSSAQLIAGATPSNPHIPTASEVTANQFTFGNIPAGSGYSVTVLKDGCAPDNAPPSCGPPGITRRISSTTETIESQTTVKAYPNPFSDRVKFLVTSPIAGRGSLEVYNMMGQRVKTVYQGFIQKGTQTFELSLPNQQVANLVYVLRIDDKKTTGKILQINR